MIEVNVTVTDNDGNFISLAHGDVANLQYLLDKLVKPVGYVFNPRPWTKEELAALDKDTKVEISTEESPDGCAKDDECCACPVCLRNHI